MRLIDADALTDELTQRCCKNCVKRMGTKNGERKMIYEIGDAPCKACEVDDMKVELDAAPTIDAEPVRCGHWVYEEQESFEYEGESVGYFVCSECGHAVWSKKENPYCSNCGAKMEEVKDDE